MKRSTLFSSLFVLSVLLSANGEDQVIEGAFGMDLGATLEESQVIGTAELTDGTPMYQFEATSPYRAFQSYWVLVTPKTKQIYSIWGRGEFWNSAKADAEGDVLASLLEKKYGKRDEHTVSTVMSGDVIFTRGARVIHVKAGEILTGELEIHYYDKNLSVLADKERFEIEGAKADASGL